MQVKNELQHLAMNQGVTRKRKLWSKAGEKVLRELPLKPWASRRREDLFKVREMLNGQIDLLDQAVKEAAQKNEARLLMTQPGVGPIAAITLWHDHGRCVSLSARQTGGQLPGVDSTGIQLRRPSALRSDQQTGQWIHANAAGGSGAGRSALRSADAAGIFASLPQESQGSGKSSSSEEIGDSTLLDAAHQSKAYPEVVPVSRAAPRVAMVGRKQIDRRIDWALSPRRDRGPVIRRIMVVVEGRIDGWRNDSPEVDSP